MSKSHIPTVNAPIHIDVLVGQFVNEIANESKACQKWGRPISSKDKNPRKRKEANIQDEPNKEIDTLEESKDITNEITPEGVQVPKIDKIDENEDISIGYVFTRKR